MTAPVSHARLVRWRLAIFAIFLISGLGFATWASRVPDIKIALGIDKAQVGILLFGSGVGAMVGLSIAALLMARFGARRSMAVLLTLTAVSLALIGVGVDVFASFPVTVAGLVLFGVTASSVDIMMNVEGAAVEQRTGRTLMPMFHALFSVGTVLGAGIGAGLIALHVNVLTHTAIIGALLVIIALVSTAQVPTGEPVADDESARPSWRERMRVTLSAWREPRTYGLGLVMLGMAFAEGGANDWLALGIVEEHGAERALGAAGLAVFSTAMTVARLVGGPLVDRFGRVPVLRVLAVFAGGGILLFVFAPNLPLVFVGAVLWGVGAALGFPLGMSAAADDPAHAAARVSAAATIGYVSFLCGPPLLGFIAEHIGLSSTLLILVGLVVVSGLAAPAARPLSETRETDARNLSS